MMSAIVKRGALIVFEGCDRSGKSTQCRKLFDTLTKEGRKVELLRFPDRSTAIGGIIGQYLEKKVDLEDHAVHLLFAANRREQMAAMTEKLRNGTTLIVDRYAFSGVAFTSAKGCGIDWCKVADQGIIAPDVVFYMQLSPEAASLRKQFGQERYEVNSFQKKVAKQYKLLEDDTWKVCNNVIKGDVIEKHIICADREIEEIHQDIRASMEDIFNQINDVKLKKLWGECDKEAINGYWTPEK